MKDKQTKRGARLSPAMVENKATERLKKRLQDLGVIVNAGKAVEPEDKKKGGKKSRRK